MKQIARIDLLMMRKRKSSRPQSHMILLVIIALLMIGIVALASQPREQRSLSYLKANLFESSSIYKN